LDDLCTILDCGCIGISDTNDPLDGWIMLRKGKERGYEDGNQARRSRFSDAAAASSAAVSLEFQARGRRAGER
jgi:hypothetical protein